MVVNLVLRCSVCECCDIRVVSVREDPHSAGSEDLRQQVRRPEHTRLAACPCIFGVAVQTMHEDDTIKQSSQLERSLSLINSVDGNVYPETLVRGGCAGTYSTSGFSGWER